MSKMSKVVETTLKHKGYKEHTGNKDGADEYMEKRSAVEDETYKIPKLLYHTKVKSKEMFGCQMIIFNESLNAEYNILYLHGGAYVSEIQVPHIIFCDNLAKKVNATVFAPVYPLAPNHTYDETYKIVESLYDLMLKFEKPITIMGDSAGGGLSASFCEYLKTNDLTLPEHLILLSPWVDISMSGDYDEYIDLDPMLGVDGLREMGEAWAGDLDTKDFRVSPLFGDMEKLPQTTIFVGTHEILYSDVVKFYNKLKDNGIEVELIVGEEMPHVYPLYSGVPEAKEAFNHIVEVIRD
ncbi:alpha/beta hydrolase fold domain-containing protein [Methanobrevibacter sp.]|uniref:alpha/beta hydrolase fold domain-containing protein n=1 Tax=Methanobrevibacter sp. TaxID=66852 RepID=UPI00388F6EDA